MHTASEAQVTGVARGGVGRGGAAEKVRWWERNVVGVVLVLRGRRRKLRRNEVRRAFIWAWGGLQSLVVLWPERLG